MKKIIVILLSIIAFSSSYAETGKALINAGKMIRRPSSVLYPTQRGSYVAANRYPYIYPYAGVAIQSYTFPITYKSEPVGAPVWPKIVIGAFGVFVVYMSISSFFENNKTQCNDYTTQENLYPVQSHSPFVELANSGGILIR